MFAYAFSDPNNIANSKTIHCQDDTARSHEIFNLNVVGLCT